MKLESSWDREDEENIGLDSCACDLMSVLRTRESYPVAPRTFSRAADHISSGSGTPQSGRFREVQTLNKVTFDMSRYESAASGRPAIAPEGQKSERRPMATGWMSRRDQEKKRPNMAEVGSAIIEMRDLPNAGRPRADSKIASRRTLSPEVLYFAFVTGTPN